MPVADGGRSFLPIENVIAGISVGATLGYIYVRSGAGLPGQCRTTPWASRAGYLGKDVAVAIAHLQWKSGWGQGGLHLR